MTSPETGLVTRDQLKVEILESERRMRGYVDARFDKLEDKLEERFARVDERFAQIDIRFEQSDARLAQFETRIVRQNWIAMMVLVVGLIASVLLK